MTLKFPVEWCMTHKKLETKGECALAKLGRKAKPDEILNIELVTASVRRELMRKLEEHENALG